tara:strand:- start:147 stop:521 length:375 start_codon:yes stop_codon:yes gene_type:complete
MFKRIILFVFVVCISTSVYAKDVATEAALIKDTYKTQDILLLFKSCYETLYFLGNTKYKGTRKPLTEEKVSKQCFCICDKIRKKYPSETFLNRQSSELQKIIAPLSNECIQDLGPFWEDNIENE